MDDVARATRVASRYLEALEHEDFAALPASVFTRGYIRAYCQVLDVPADEALARYSEHSGTKVSVVAAPVAPTTPRAVEDRRRSRGTLVLSVVLLIGFGVALFAVALLLQSGRPEIGTRRAETPPAPVARVEVPAPPPSAPSPEPPPAPTAATPPAETHAPAAAVPDVSAAVPQPPPVPPRVAPAPPPAVAPPARAPAPPPPVARTVEPKPSAPPEPRPAPDPPRPAAAPAEPPPLRLGGVVSPYRLVARTVESTWLRVRTDDGRATEETIPPGEVREWISNRPFVLTIGNAAGVTLELNGQKLPPLGARGAVIGRLVLPPGEP